MGKFKSKNSPTEISIIPLGKEKVVFKGKIIEVVQQEMKCMNEVKLFEWIRRSPGTRSIIVSPQDKILIIKEYRNELKGYDYRLPGGKVFNRLQNYNEYLKQDTDIINKAKEGAKRELIEETGIIPNALDHFYTSKCGTTVIWDLIYFVVTKYKKVEEGPQTEAGEDITINWFTKNEVKRMCIEGEISEDRSSNALLRYLLGKQN